MYAFFHPTALEIHLKHMVRRFAIISHLSRRVPYTNTPEEINHGDLRHYVKII